MRDELKAITDQIGEAKQALSQENNKLVEMKKEKKLYQEKLQASET
jgi:hypothetical protein